MTKSGAITSRRQCAIALIAYCLSVAIGCRDDPPASQPAVPLITQSRTERLWKTPDFTELPGSRTFSGYHLVGPYQYRKQGVYVIDLGDLSVKRIGLDGRLQVVYGRGPGEGPGELQAIQDFYVHPRGDVFIVSGNQRLLSHFTARGEFVARYPLEACHPHRIVGLDVAHLAIWCLHPQQPNPMFLTLTLDAQPTGRFGTLIDASVPMAFFAYEGWMVDRPEGGFVFVSMRASYLYFFDATERLERIIQTIDRLEYPLDRLQASDRITSRALSQPVHQFLLSFTEKAFFVTVGIQQPQGGRLMALDRYDRTTGQYMYSARLPINGMALVADPYVFISAGDTTLAIYQVHWP